MNYHHLRAHTKNIIQVKSIFLVVYLVIFFLNCETEFYKIQFPFQCLMIWIFFVTALLSTAVMACVGLRICLSPALNVSPKFSSLAFWVWLDSGLMSSGSNQVKFDFIHLLPIQTRPLFICLHEFKRGVFQTSSTYKSSLIVVISQLDRGFKSKGYNMIYHYFTIISY